MNKLNAENKKLSKMIVDSDNKWKKDLDAKDAYIGVLKHDLQESIDHQQLLVDKNDQLEKEELKVQLDVLEIEKSDWDNEKQRIEDLSFQKGFDFYLLGFIANDPDYDWSKFGPGCAEDIEEFKRVHADAIKAKRVELGLEKDPKDAPSTEDIPKAQNQDTQTSPVANPDQDSIPEVVTPLTIVRPSDTQGASPTASKDAPKCLLSSNLSSFALTFKARVLCKTL